VISTVNPQSRRAARAQQLTSAQRRQEASSEPAAPRSSSKGIVWGAIGGAVGAAALVLIVLASVGVL